ncbi:zinc metalloprotease [Pseudomonas sp. LB1P83]
MKEDETSARDKRSLMDENPEQSKNPILLMVYIHSDLDEYDINELNHDYFSWARTELQDISNRNIDMILITKSTSPEMANFDYKDVSSAYSLHRWSQLVNKTSLRIPAAQSYHPKLIKHLLLTRNPINEKIAGVAYSKDECGIASISSYMTPAHEIGHMLGATHEDAEVIYNGWWHDTIMKPVNALHGNDYRFSDKNRENIRNYLSKFD